MCPEGGPRKREESARSVQHLEERGREGGVAGGREKRRQLCVFESVCTLVWEERQWRHCLSPQQSLEDGWCEEHQLILASAALALHIPICANEFAFGCLQERRAAVPT